MAARFDLALAGDAAGDSVSLALARAPLSCGQRRHAVAPPWRPVLLLVFQELINRFAN